MYTIIKKLGLLQFAKQEIIPFTASLMLAEYLYKFGSFTLECVAFLATWYSIGRLMRYIK